jgi:4-amino-4-deoxy-L-arabinose transferase-like glycosyltransferase
MYSDEMQLVRRSALIILGLVVLRMVAAVYTPPLIDETYYWMLSKNLAGGYYDHPPMFAVVIRLGTMIAGDTEFGIRLVSILLVLPMSWAVYRAAAILFDSSRVGSTAAIQLNVTMMVSVGTMLVTPDVPLMVASSFVLLALIKVLKTGRGAWWLAVGAAVGTALLSKYTALFFGPIILVWLTVVPKLRHWLISPWPYLGGLIALAIFSPTLLWNADHQWVSFNKQFGRAQMGGFDPRTFAQMIPSQFAFATPGVFLLAVSGHYALFKGLGGTRAASTLINTTVWTFILYFTVHSLHDNVHPQWLSPMYPALAVAAAVAADLVAWGTRWQRVVNWLVRWSVPGSVLMFAVLMFQTHTGLLNGFRRDETAGQIAVGFRDVATEIEAIRTRVGATCVLVSYYGTTAWLEFYMPKGTCVEQRSERIRWANTPEPDPVLLKGKLLYVGEGNFGLPRLEADFDSVKKLAELSRKRGPLAIETYTVLLLEGAKGEVLDRSPP